MGITATIVADSVHRRGPGPRRLTTFQLRFPRFVLPELATHRMFSKNSASSRAIPIEKMVEDVLRDPAMFVFWGKNQKGMQAATEMSADEIEGARADWLESRDSAVEQARKLLKRGLHKQNVNRLLEPFMHIIVLCTATDWANFYCLRRDAMAQPEMQALANAMWDAHSASTPVDRTNLRGVNEWHLPLVGDEERFEFGDAAVLISTGRCARVSYLRHDGVRDWQADIELANRLSASGHWSPFEHAAKPYVPSWWRRMLKLGDCSGNFSGWQQARKDWANEHPYTPGQVTP